MTPTVRDWVRRYATRASTPATASVATATSTVGCHCARSGQYARSLPSRVSRGVRLRSITRHSPYITLKNGHLGGVIDARTADTIRGLEVEQIGLTPEDSLLDAIFGNVLGTLLALPTQPNGTPHAGCKTPDIDVDRDGLEIFCDTNSDNDPDKLVVDLCVDGDGTEVRDTVVGGVVQHCTEAIGPNGKPRFVDGISVELNFETAPATLVAP